MASIISILLVFQTDDIPEAVTIKTDKKKLNNNEKVETAKSLSSMLTLPSRTIIKLKNIDSRKVFRDIRSIS